MIEDMGRLASSPEGTGGIGQDLLSRSWQGAAASAARAKAAEAARGAALFFGTMVETASGPRPVETLASGDLIRTRNNGYQPLRWAGRGTASPGHAVRLRPGALRETGPTAELSLPGHQRVLIASARADALFGASEVLVAAGALDHLDTVDPVPWGGSTAVLLFDAHEIVLAGGLWVESFLPDEAAMAALPPEEAADLKAAYPRLCHATGQAGYISARMVLNAREARLVTDDTAVSVRGSARAG